MRRKEKYAACGAAIVGAAGLLGTAPSFADGKATEFFYQENQQRFVTQTQDGRMVGMAGSTRLTTANSVATVNNPGGLGLMKYGDISLGYGHNTISGNNYPVPTSVEDTQNSGQVYGVVPLGPVKDDLPDYGNLALGWFGRSGDWSDDPDNTDTSMYQVSAAYAKAIGHKTALGYSLTYQNDSVDADTYEYDSTNSFLHNLGLQVRDSEDLTFGGSVTFGHGSHELKNKFAPLENQTVDQFSFGIGTGAEYTMDTTAIALGLDYTYYHNNGDETFNDTAWGGSSHANSLDVRLGVEERVIDWLALRAGYRYAGNFNWDYQRAGLEDLSGTAKYNAVSMGLGIDYAFADGSTIRAIRADYGAEYKDIGDGDWQHMVTLATPFDLCL